MFINQSTAADGFYGMNTTVTTENGIGVDSETNTVLAFYPERLTIVADIISNMPSSQIKNDNIIAKIPNGGYIAFFSVEEVFGVQFALCSYSWNENDSGWRNEFVYIIASAINYSPIINMFPSKISYNESGEKNKNPLFITDTRSFEHSGEAWICTSDDVTWVLNPQQVLFNSCDQIKDEGITESLNNQYFYTEVIGKYTIVSAVLDYPGGLPIIETIGPGNVEYLLITYNGYSRYVKKSNFQRYDGSTPILKIFEEQGNTIDSNVKISTESVTVKKEACILNSDQVVKWKGSHQANVDADNYLGLLTPQTKIDVCAYEIINNSKFLIRICGGLKNYYIPVNAIEITDEEFSNSIHSSERQDLPDRNTSVVDSSSSNGNESVSDTIGNNNPIYDYAINSNLDIKETDESKKINGESNSGNNEIHGDKRANNRWYEITLPVGIYPDDEMNKRTGAIYLEENSDTRLPSDWSDYDSPNESLFYSLQEYAPEYLSKEEGWSADKRQISKINRFKYITNKSGLSTKSFIFMTKPDLNLYKLDENNNVVHGSMNPDLLRLPEFKYIGRNKDVGYDILDSLEYYGTSSGNTPWLSIITNQAEGYSPIDREIGYTEVGETFHGHKVLYGKHDFKHNVAGTVTIPFTERRDLSLYYTLKIWTEYIHCINIGLVEPHPVHLMNKELDYAVALYYIQTDETMENILYWEKLTGVFPLKCPDSFFAWNKGESGKNMEYDIEFAYSMRSVLRTPDLLELDRLYMKNCSNDAETTYYKASDGTYTNKTIDLMSNRYIAKMAAYFNIERHDDLVDKFGQTIYRPSYPSSVNSGDKPLTKYADTSSTEYQNFVNELLANPNSLSKYFYEPYYPETGKASAAEFLSNYSIYLQSPGIPYVTGPFVVPHPEYNGGKFLLKWV